MVIVKVGAKDQVDDEGKANETGDDDDQKRGNLGHGLLDCWQNPVHIATDFEHPEYLHHNKYQTESINDMALLVPAGFPHYVNVLSGAYHLQRCVLGGDVWQNPGKHKEKDNRKVYQNAKTHNIELLNFPLVSLQAIIILGWTYNFLVDAPNQVEL